VTDPRTNRAAYVESKVTCYICLTAEPLLTAEDHHVRPRAFGGTDDEKNRKWLCGSCHGRLHRVQGLILQGKQASAYEVCNAIFTTDGKARGRLWALANEAVEAEREVKEGFASHKTHQKVTLKLEVDLWALIKAQAKDHKMPASRYAAALLEKAVRGE
jgi:predicted DNA binding CopG/RHH family protein